MHKDRGWSRIGYHAVIRLDGSVEPGRPMESIGAHVKGFNRTSIGVCVIGGVDEHGNPSCTINEEQLDSLEALIASWKQRYPDARVVGHRDLSPDVDGDGVIEEFEWLKACPSFDVAYWLRTGKAVFSARNLADDTG